MYTVKWFHILLYISHNLTFVFCLHTVFSIRPIDRNLWGASIPGHSGPGSNGNEEALLISPNFLGYSLAIKLFNVISRTLIEWGSYLSAEMPSVYSIAPANWAVETWPSGWIIGILQLHYVNCNSIYFCYIIVYMLVIYFFYICFWMMHDQIKSKHMSKNTLGKKMNMQTSILALTIIPLSLPFFREIYKHDIYNHN